MLDARYSMTIVTSILTVIEIRGSLRGKERMTDIYQFSNRILIKFPQPLPWDELIQLGKHLIDLDPVLKIPGRADVGPLIHHYPAHVGGTIFATRAVPGFRRTAAMHGVQIGCPANKLD